MAVTSYKFFGTIVSETIPGGNATNWVNPGNAGADDTSYATLGLSTASSDTGAYLKFTNPGFTSGDVASGSTIDGIEDEMGVFETSATDNIFNLRYRSVKGGTINGTNVTGLDTTTEWGTSAVTIFTVGGATNLMQDTWTQSDVTSSTFGGAHSPNCTGTTPDANVDYYKRRIYYTASTGSVGDATGVGTATGVGAATTSASASATGVGTATGTGRATASSTGAATGVGTATGVGVAQAQAPASATGVGVATGVGASTARSPGSATGVGAATGTGQSTASSPASATGVGVATGTGRATASSPASATGVGVATGVGAAFAPGVGSATGAGVATGVGAAITASTGAATGVGNAAGVGAATVAAIGNATGVGDAAAVGDSTGGSTIVTAAGNASGTSSGDFVSSSTGTLLPTGTGGRELHPRHNPSPDFYYEDEQPHVDAMIAKTRASLENIISGVLTPGEVRVEPQPFTPAIVIPKAPITPEKIEQAAVSVTALADENGVIAVDEDDDEAVIEMLLLMH